MTAKFNTSHKICCTQVHCQGQVKTCALSTKCMKSTKPAAIICNIPSIVTIVIIANSPINTSIVDVNLSYISSLYVCWNSVNILHSNPLQMKKKKTWRKRGQTSQLSPEPSISTTRTRHPLSTQELGMKKYSKIFRENFASKLSRRHPLLLLYGKIDESQGKG